MIPTVICQASFRVGLIALGLWWLPGAVLFGPTQASGESRERPVVILLSWDGVRHDYPDRLELPGLGRMQRQGMRASRLVPVYPSDTFPNHVSLATCTYPDRHGILANKFRDRARDLELFSYGNDADWIEAEPLWVAAERQGVRSAVFFWVGSETDWRGVGASYRREPFDASIREDEKVDQILAWLALPRGERPRLIMSWWHGADSVGHRKGPDHPDVARALASQDRQLSRLLAELDARGAWPHTTLLVVSDHGMTEVTNPLRFSERLKRAGISALVTRSSATAHVFLRNPAQLGAAERVLADVQGLRVYRRDAVPEALRLRHPSRAGDLVLLTNPPNTLVEPSVAREMLARTGALIGWSRGMHGYLPDHPDMGAIFFALGRGVPEGSALAEVRNIDVAPTVARLLGIEAPAACEGRPIPEIAGVE